jgi:hypothetical protein
MSAAASSVSLRLGRKQFLSLFVVSPDWIVAYTSVPAITGQGRSMAQQAKDIDNGLYC